MSNYNRIFNFSAGPSMLPVPVLEKAAKEMLNYNGSGMSVMEMSHRSKVFIEIADQATALLREVMSIPDNYKILYMQGGGNLQFSAVPMNLKKNGVADYVVSGNFSNAAAKEAKKFINVNIAATSAETNFATIPQQNELKISPNSDYIHICFNNTIYGTKYNYIPDGNGVPVVADISSCILSEPLDISKFGLLYAGVQKNLAPAGMAIVIIREDLLVEPEANTPIMLNYKICADNDSMHNTPNCWNIYMIKLVLEYIKEQGGVEAMAKKNYEKANLLYDYLDNSKMFKGIAGKEYRSIMNVSFNTGSDELDAKFIKEAAALGMSNLKGHRLINGMRASIYNNMPYEGVEALVNFMKEFEAKNQ